MTGQAASVFGPNSPTRIAGTAQVMLEPGEVAPSLPWYQPLVPFYPPSLTSGSGSSNSLTADGHIIWEHTPSRCDLVFYQGDDVIIPLYFNDPSVTDDRSTQTWVAQVRLIHRYQSRLVAQFVTAAEYMPGDETVENTKVELFMPRTENLHFGQFRWDLYSLGAEDLTRFQEWPEGMGEDEQWPPLDVLRTWLYGIVTISPRVTDTDVLINDESGSGIPIPYPGPPPDVTVLTTGGWCVGPNGRVP